MSYFSSLLDNKSLEGFDLPVSHFVVAKSNATFKRAQLKAQQRESSVKNQIELARQDGILRRR